MSRLASLIVLLLCVSVSAETLPSRLPANTIMLRYENGDTIYCAFLPEVLVFPKMKFKNKKQERFYWRTVRDVKRCLPLAKMIAKEIDYADSQLEQIPDEKERKKWWRKFEKQLFKKYEKELRDLYASQGRMLIKLVDRETNKTGYELIAHYKSKAAANFWQFIAKLFRNDLKEEYDGRDKDQIIERVIALVEAGQL